MRAYPGSSKDELEVAGSLNDSMPITSMTIS